MSEALLESAAELVVPGGSRGWSSWTRLLAGIPLPMLLFLGFIVVAAIVRFMRGGTAQSGAAMPTHPMQGMIALVSSLFGKKQQ